MDPFDDLRWHPIKGRNFWAITNCGIPLGRVEIDERSTNLSSGPRAEVFWNTLDMVTCQGEQIEVYWQPRAESEEGAAMLNLLAGARQFRGRAVRVWSEKELCQAMAVAWEQSRLAFVASQVGASTIDLDGLVDHRLIKKVTHV